MHKVVQLVTVFHEKCGFGIQDSPHLPANRKLRESRMRQLEDKYHEYRAAERASDLVKISDCLADLIYIVIGTCLEYGIPIQEVFHAVHESNMSKVDPWPAFDENKKLVKGPNYHKPNIAEILCERMYGEGKYYDT